MRTIDKLQSRASQKHSDEIRHIAVLANSVDVLQDSVHVRSVTSTDGGVHITVHRDDKALVSKILDGLGFGPGADSTSTIDFTFYGLSGSTLYVTWTGVAREAA